jgi:hypothetical protein
MLAPRPEDRPQTGHEVFSVLTEITRSYGFESSTPRLAQYVSELFADELVPTGRAASHSDVSRRDTGSNKVALGSGLSLSAAGAVDDGRPPVVPSRTSSSFSLAPGSLTIRNTPAAGLDVSVSLARRSNPDIAPVKPELAAAPMPVMPMMPDVDLRRSTFRIAIIAAVLVALAVAAYLLLRT